MNPANPLKADFQRVQRMAAIVGVVGLVAAVIGLFAVGREQFFQSYLFGFLFWNGFMVGSTGIYLLHNVVGGNWGVVIRRFIEAGARTLPLNFLLILPILFFGIPSLYFWAQPAAQHDANVQFKAAYLNTPFFIARTFFFFAVWAFYIFRLTALSKEQDRTGDPGIQPRMKAMSTFGLLLFVLTVSFAFIDWIMSLEPKWFSTVYGAMFLVGQVLETFAFSIALLVLLSKYRPFVQVLNKQLYHDLGNLMLAFTMLWAYLSLAQFLIIWAGNLPEEIPWYIRRFTGGWGYIAWFLGIFHFCVPFVILLMRFVKKNASLLQKVAIYMLVVRCVDVFWIVEPAFRQQKFYVHWLDLACLVGVGGLWIAAFLWRLQERPLLPLHDPRLGYHPLETEAESTA
jgi:hypothetical protein